MISVVERTNIQKQEVTVILRIAICDDMPNELQNMVLLIKEYLTLNELDAEVAEFSQSNALIEAITKESYHLYILDVVMPLLNGLELGKEIRRLDREAQIIYATTEPQFALQAYAASPINYLLKPIEKYQLFDTLSHAIFKIDLSDERSFNVKTSDSLRVIKLSDIVCCEYCNHAVKINLRNGDEVVSRTIRESFSVYSSPILKDRHFVQCHASFIVNMRWTERFSKESFMMSGGIIVPIAPKQYATVRDVYMDYLMKKGGM